MSASQSPRRKSSQRPGAGRPVDPGLPARRRAQIIAQAIEHFASSGYAGADLDAIAADVGCAKGTLYNYFPSKADLFAASVDAVGQGLSHEVDACDSTDGIEQIEHLVRSFLAYFSAHPQYVELLIQERSDFRDRPAATYVRFRAQRRRVWSQRLGKLMSQGRLRRMAPERALDVLADSLYGVIFTNYFRRRRPRTRQQAEDLLNVMLAGLLTPREQSHRAKVRRNSGSP